MTTIPRETTPADLVRAASTGDARAWDELVHRYSGLLWSICRDHRLDAADAGDVVQVTWLRLLERLGSLNDPARVGGWLATTCRHECLAVIRRTRRTAPSTDTVEQRAAPENPADVDVLRSDRDATVWEAFGRLGERCRKVLAVLVAEAEDGPPSYARAAERLQMPIGSLGPTRARCLAQLRELLVASGIYGYGTDS